MCNMTLMVIKEKGTDMSVTSPSTLQSPRSKKKETLRGTLTNPSIDNGSTNMASSSGPNARLEETGVDKLRPKEDKNLISSHVNLEPVAFEIKSNSNLESAKQGSLDNNSVNVYNKQATSSVPKTPERSLKKEVGGGETSGEMSSEMFADPRKNRFLRRSNSDVSLHRFRIASEDSDSIKSIRSSPFQPKPPIIPRKTRPKPRTKPKHDLDSSEENNAMCVTNQRDLPQPTSNYEHRKPQRSSSQTELTTVQPSSSDHNSLHYDSDNSDEYIVRRVNSALSVRSLPTPLSHRLPPMASVSSLPPFNQNFSSKVLRTTYKSEPLFHTPRLWGGSLETCSQSSFASSGSALPTITVREARSRSYLYGNINSGVALLGSDELKRYFPDRKVKLFVGTWNMEGNKDLTSQRIVDFILPESCELVQDIYAIGTQENSMHKKEWEIRLQENLGPSYVLFHSTSLGSLHLALFMRRDLIWFCSNLEENNLTTRAVTMIKTKGSVAIAFSFFGTSILIINSHFTASYQKMSDRVRDYEKTIRELRLTKGRLSHSKKDVIGSYDSVFWIGDFNFRVDGDACPVERMLKVDVPNFEKILRCDQLLQLINEDKIFQGFQEGRIEFPPTFKFDVKSKVNAYHKLRTPSYTDRVLFRSRRKNCITCVHYNCAERVIISDHKPVFGIYEVSIRPGRDLLTMDAGRFNKEVYIEANKRRALNQSAKPMNHKSSSVCSIQ